MEIRMRSNIYKLIFSAASPQQSALLAQSLDPAAGATIGPTKSAIWLKRISGGEAFRRTHCR
jgi:hypothetical protein